MAPKRSPKKMGTIAEPETKTKPVRVDLHPVVHKALRRADGKRAVVDHPEFIAHRPGGRVAVVVGPDDSTCYIDVGLVLRLELAPPVPAGSIAPNPNGGE